MSFFYFCPLSFYLLPYFEPFLLGRSAGRESSWINKIETNISVQRWEIVTSELKRLYEFYIGLPVSPRTWKFERPNLDEL